MQSLIRLLPVFLATTFACTMGLFSPFAQRPRRLVALRSQLRLHFLPSQCSAEASLHMGYHKDTAATWKNGYGHWNRGRSIPASGWSSMADRSAHYPPPVTRHPLRVVIGVQPHVFGRQVGGPEAHGRPSPSLNCKLDQRVAVVADRCGDGLAVELDRRALLDRAGSR